MIRGPTNIITKFSGFHARVPVMGSTRATMLGFYRLGFIVAQGIGTIGLKIFYSGLQGQSGDARTTSLLGGLRCFRDIPGQRGHCRT